MTVPFMTFGEMINSHFIPNGYLVVSPQPLDFWNEHDRVMVKKDDYAFPLQFRKVYYYLQIVPLW